MAKKKTQEVSMPTEETKYTFKFTVKDGESVYLKGESYALCKSEYEAYKKYVYETSNLVEKKCKSC